MAVTIYHNPRCSKSRETLKLLQELGQDIEIIEYLKTPPNETTLAGIIRTLGITPRELLRKGETEYKELGLKSEEHTDEEIIQAMAKHPKLMERPVVLANGKAVIGRPPENVKMIL